MTLGLKNVIDAMVNIVTNMTGFTRLGSMDAIDNAPIKPPNKVGIKMSTKSDISNLP